VKERIWINFKELRARLKIESVLEHFGVAIRGPSKTQHQGPCPLPGHIGSRNSLSFSANLERGIFHCFSCGAKGNILEFAALMSGVDVKDGIALRKVALELQTKFFPSGLSVHTPQTANHPSSSSSQTSSPRVNAPLDFALKGLDGSHPYLLECGFSPETIQHFGLGFCARGTLKDKIAIPLHSQNGELIGYVGQTLNETSSRMSNARYSFPESRERNGISLKFDSSLVLYNANRIGASRDELIVVTGFDSVWWLHQCGLSNVVAVFDQASEQQMDLIVSMVKANGRVWIMPNGDKDGASLARVMASQLSASRFTRWINLGNESRPADLSAQQIRSYLK
jgi:DNA primase